MIPAPAQGAIMIAALENDDYVKEACAELNHEHTELCTTIERDFLRLLEGGCTAPIGALAYVKDEEVHFKGVLLSVDGTKKIEVSRKEQLGNHHDIASFCSGIVIERGGKRLMDDLKRDGSKTNIYSTKNLSESQRHLFHDKVQVESNDAIKINFNRINRSILKSPITNVVITSKNGVESILNTCPKEELQFKNIYCVGRRTKRLIEQKIGSVKHSEKNAKALADYLVEYIEGTEVTYFCSNLRLDDLPNTLTKNNIAVNEVEAYETKYDAKKVNDTIEGVMFYSPSTVESFTKENRAKAIAFCIGESTAKTARQYFTDVRVAKVPTVESVIELVNEHYV